MECLVLFTLVDEGNSIATQILVVILIIDCYTKQNRTRR